MKTNLLSPTSGRRVLGSLSSNANNGKSLSTNAGNAKSLHPQKQPIVAKHVQDSKLVPASEDGDWQELIPLSDGTGKLILLKEKLGKGGFATVHKGVLPGSSKQVAVKVVCHERGHEEDGRDDVAREVRTHQMLMDHEIENQELRQSQESCDLFVKLLYQIEEPSRSILVLPLLPGCELFDHVITSQAGRLPEASARKIARHLGKALAFLHAAGVAHLDIKPQNVLVTERGSSEPQVRLIDYGCSDLFDPSDVTEAWVDECGGTDNYMSPERHFDDDPEGRGFLAPPADVYGLGCVFFFMICGMSPFDWMSADTDGTSAELVRQIRTGEMPFESDSSEEVQGLIRHMCRADPLERPSAAGLLEHAWLAQPVPQPPDEAAVAVHALLDQMRAGHAANMAAAANAHAHAPMDAKPSEAAAVRHQSTSTIDAMFADLSVSVRGGDPSEP